MGNRHIDPATRAAVLETEGTNRAVGAALGISPQTVARVRAARPAPLVVPRVGRPRLDTPSSATRQQRQRRERIAADRVMSGTAGEAATPTNTAITAPNRTAESAANGTNRAARIPDPRMSIRGILGTHCASCGQPLKAHDRYPSGWPAGYPGPCSGAA
jgi:hypothetical protein